MKEIGGYIELDTYNLPMLHNEAIALNCGRNCLAYLIQTKNIKNIILPKFLCSSVENVCKREKINVSFYSIGKDFLPVNISLREDEWLYIVNYYGQIDNHIIQELLDKYERIIIDNAQAYFQMPLKNVDTLYTCRKYFGVADGAFLYTDKMLDKELSIDESFERMHYLLGRFERTASEFYSEYSRNNHFFVDEPIMKTSKLTMNLLHGIDYEFVKQRRTENFTILHNEFKHINKLELTIPEGAFMYPLYIENGYAIRKKLQEKKIYIPTLWPDVFKYCEDTDLEYDLARNILPLPIDQRYGIEEMQYMIEIINQHLKEGGKNSKCTL